MGAAWLMLALLASPLAAQRIATSVWPDYTWVHGTINDHGACAGHLCAHLVGGAVTDLLARGPWFAENWRRSFGGRMALAALPTLWWEVYQQKENQEPLKYGIWDFLTGMVGAALTDALLTTLSHRRLLRGS
jgi:hypothetical protein